MAVATVADDVDDEILLPLDAVVGGELADKVDDLDVVAVDVERAPPVLLKVLV